MAYARPHKNMNNKLSNQESDIESMSNWNPMADAYKNEKFNAFTEGPGADLDDDLQPGALAVNTNRNKGQNHASEGKYKIVLRNVPKNMTKSAIRNFCSNYGKVLNVHDTPSCPNMAFISYATLNDMTNTLTSINDDNKFGIIAEFGKKRENRNENKEKKDNNYNSKTNSVCSDQSFKENKTSSTKHQFSKLDMKRRIIKGPFTNPPRLIHIKNEPFVTEYDYKNSNLIMIDPKRYFLIEKDMHYNDRIKKYEINNADEDEKYGKLIHTGRSYYIESRGKMDHLKKLSESSEGKFNQHNNSFEKRCSKSTSNDIILEKCAFCAKLANKMCEGCKKEHYCSVECQRIDWQRHQNHCNVEERHFGIESESRKISTKLEKIDQKFNDENKRLCNGNENKSNTTRNSNNNFQNNTSRVNHQNKCSQQNNTNSKSTQQASDNKTKPTSSTSTSSSTPPLSSELPSSSSSLSLPSDKNHEDPLELIKKKSFQYAAFPKSGSNITITSVTSPNLFYIRSMDSEDDIQYVKILNIINGFTTNAKNLKNLPKRGDICLTDFQNTGYYRALVLNPINEHKIIVIYIDFGNIEEKNLTDLKEAPQEVQYLKCYAVPVRLKNVPDFIPLQNLKDYIYSYVDRLDLDLKLIYDDGISIEKNDCRNIEVEIIDTTNNICINKKILEMRVINEPKDRDVPILRENIKQELLPSGKNIEVFVLDNSLLSIGFISCILPQNYLPIQELSTQLKEYAEKIDGVYTPRTSEICVVKYDEDNEWYRAECLEVVGDEHPSVQFIDYGNMLPVHISKIRKYPKAFKDVPCYTSSCMIDGLPEVMSVNLIKRLEEIIPINEKLIITDVTSKIIDDDTNVIYLPEIIDQLKAEKLL